MVDFSVVLFSRIYGRLFPERKPGTELRSTGDTYGKKKRRMPRGMDCSTDVPLPIFEVPAFSIEILLGKCHYFSGNGSGNVQELRESSGASGNAR